MESGKDPFQRQPAFSKRGRINLIQQVKEINDCVIVLRVLQTPILKTCVTAIRLVLSAEKILLAVGATTEVGGEWVPAEWEGPQDPWKRKRHQLL